jgi:hypothetical protein
MGGAFRLFPTEHVSQMYLPINEKWREYIRRCSEVFERQTMEVLTGRGQQRAA